MSPLSFDYNWKKVLSKENTRYVACERQHQRFKDRKMSVYSSTESNWNPTKKHSILSNGEYSSPTKRSRPLTDESDQSDGEPYSPSDDPTIDNQQRIIRQPQASLRESTLISTGQPSKAILELLDDDDEDEEDVEAYSPSQLDPATMDEVSHQLKGNPVMIKTAPAKYVPPPVLINPPQQDIDYREKKKSST